MSRGGKQYDRPTPRWDQIRALAEEAGPAGVNQAELRARIDIKAPVLWSALLDYVKRGWLFKIGRPTMMRYFLRKEWADAYPQPPSIEEVAKARIKRRTVRVREKRQAVAAARPPKPPKPKAAPKPKAKAEKADRPFAKRIIGNAPVTVTAPKLKQSVEIVVPPGIEVQKGPSYTHDPRFQMAPGAKVRGDFSKLGIGRYLPTEAA